MRQSFPYKGETPCITYWVRRIGEPGIMHQRFVVGAIWDNEAGVWSASSEDVRGLAIEADDLDALARKAGAAILDLIEANGDFPDVTSFNVEVRAEAPERVLVHAH